MLESIVSSIEPHQVIMLVVFAMFAISFLIMPLVLRPLFNLWFQAKLANTPVTYMELIGMKLRKIDVKEIVTNKITAKHAGLELSPQQLESHFLAGGNVTNIVRALIVADRNDLDMSFEEAAAIDLSGRDVLAMMQDAVEQDDGSPYETSGLNDYLGTVGIVVSPLIPTGEVSFEKRVECIAENGIVENGEAVKVIKVDGNKLTVKVVE